SLAGTVVAPGDNCPFSSEHDVVRPARRNRDDPPRLVKLERDCSIAPRHNDAGRAMKLPRHDYRQCRTVEKKPGHEQTNFNYSRSRRAVKKNSAGIDLSGDLRGLERGRSYSFVPPGSFSSSSSRSGYACHMIASSSLRSMA